MIALAAEVAAAQPSAPPPADPAADPGERLSSQDREAIAAAEQLASEAAAQLEQWIATQAVSEERLFSRLYFPIRKTRPQQYTTPYDELATRDLTGIEDKALARSNIFQYAIVTDINGYVPAHNTRYAMPTSTSTALDYGRQRTKRFLKDAQSLTAARSTARRLLQRTRGDAGEPVFDVSIPLIVRGKHWGCVRIGYTKPE